MGKRLAEGPITLGSGDFYIQEFTSGSTLPEHTAICVDANRFAYTSGGAELTYSVESSDATDDMGLVSKTIIYGDSAKLTANLTGFNGKTLKKLASTARVTEAASGSLFRKVLIGGRSNDDGKLYAVCFHHTDSTDGDIWITIVGKNVADLVLKFANDNPTNAPFEFKAERFDSAGSLIRYEEESTVAAG